MDDAQRDLILLAKAGDQAASAHLVELLYPLASKIVRSYVPHGHEDDVLQEVFLRVFARLGQFRADAPLEHWVSRLAVRVCIDALRRLPRRPRELRLSDLDEREAMLVREATDSTRRATPLEALAARELVEKILETLSAEDRVILTMLDIEQHSVADIARLVGRTKTSVKVRALRARRKVRHVLEELLGESSDG